MVYRVIIIFSPVSQYANNGTAQILKIRKNVLRKGIRDNYKHKTIADELILTC